MLPPSLVTVRCPDVYRCGTQEGEVEKLMSEAFPKNFIDYEEYPQTADIQNRCVSMIARMFNAPTSDETETAMGTSTVGSSEAIMLGTLA